jgi:Flp pilus assembly protein TadB
LGGGVEMIAGIMLVIAGLLIAMYPPLLSIIVAGLLIFLGVALIYLHYHYRNISKRFDNPFMDFFIRF